MTQSTTVRAALEVLGRDPELQRLTPLLGSCTTDGQTRHSVLGPGVPVSRAETFSWLDSGYFLGAVDAQHLREGVGARRSSADGCGDPAG